MPNSVKEREKEAQEPISVAANYQAQPALAPQATAPPPPPAETQPEVAQAPPAPQPEEQPKPAPQEAVPVPAPETSRELPTTSEGWLMILISGGMLSGAGWLLRRRT